MVCHRYDNRPTRRPSGVVTMLALITGSSRGIGAATAALFAAKGYDIGIHYRHKRDAAETVLQHVRSFGVKAVAIQADVSIEADVVRLFNTLDHELGCLDVLVNNAGILLPQMRVQDMDAARLQKMFTTNVTSSFLCAREAIKRLSTRQGGHGGSIVNVSSAAARLGGAGEYVDYAGSKGAIDTMTRGLSLELAADSIRVNGVRPGFIDTEMYADGGEPDRVNRVKATIPMQRGGTAREVAEAIYWLSSHASSFVTGCILDVAGGR